MFVEAIEKVANFTRPIHTIMRTYGNTQIIAGAATLFFVNELGYAVTCKHVVETMIASEAINQAYSNFKVERSAIAVGPNYEVQLKELELKYNYTPDAIVQLRITFIDSADTISGYTVVLHPTLDLAIVKLNDFNALLYTEVAVFKKEGDAIKQGETMCRLGFPFPEFTNYFYDAAQDDIQWTLTGITHSPRFPIDGMITRFLGDETGIHGIELSTPGLKGQSGGPLFNKAGIVCGMQSSTKHLHLGFDLIETEIMVENRLKKVTDYSFIHLGQCIHVERIKPFLDEHKIMYFEED